MAKPHQNQDSGIRLNRYLANSGICNRRDADKLIAKGLVEVDGKVITQMGYRVQKGQKVTYMGEEQNAESLQYVLINKPKECSCDPKAKKSTYSVDNILEMACYEKLYAVKPLEYNSTGVLLMTNDKDLFKRLSQDKKEVFHIFLNKEFKEEDIEKLTLGIKVGGKTFKAEAAHHANPNSKKEIGIELKGYSEIIITQGLKELGYKIDRLDRVFFAGLTKKNVPRGKWRFLDKKEIQFLRMQ